MNILFYTSYRVSEQKGGTERITARIAKSLKEEGFKCFSAYKSEIDSSLPLASWDGEFIVCDNNIENVIIENRIDVIVIQKMTRDVKRIFDIRNKNHVNLKILSVLHFNPGYEEISNTFSAAWVHLKTNSHNFVGMTKNTFRVLSYPIYKLYYPFRNRNLYKTVYHFSDKVVLLSDRFINEYCQYCGIKDASKFSVIPNALSYDDFLPFEKLKEKQKQVIVVSRLEETQKRISRVIKVWKRIENNKKFNDWTLKIIGDGHDKKKYMKLAEDLNLKRVVFCNRQQPKPFYEKSLIFMMTSAYEGWGLTLTEAQQFGCVPIAIGSFSSVYDIISNGKDGVIVNSNNITTYAINLENLMGDEIKLLEMAYQAILSSHRYDINNIEKLWIDLIKSN